MAVNQFNRKYIWTAVVIENEDPLMLNRIRVRFDSPLDSINVQSILDSVPDKYNNKSTKNNDNTDLLPEFKWSKIDPFCFLPLLPIFIKVTPKIGESVNILWPNPEYKFQEQYYVMGTFSSSLTIFNENSEASRLFATRDRILETPLLKNKENSNYFFESTKGVFPEPDDVALIGRGTCDIIVKNNDVLLRAGKSTTKPDNPYQQISVKKTRSFVQLSDFDVRITDLGTESAIKLDENIKYVNSLIEWKIVNPENQYQLFSLVITLYGLPQKQEYTTKNLKIDTDVLAIDKSLIYTISLNNLSTDTLIDTINTFIQQANDGQINIPTFPIIDLSNQFPLVFRPDSSTYKWVKVSTSTGTSEYLKVKEVKEKIKFKTEGDGGFGLIFDKNTPGQQPLIRTKELKKIDYQLLSTTYNIMGADKLLMLSHESKIPSKQAINLDSTTVGGIDQDYIVRNILPNTDPMVRGDELMKFLNLIVQFLIAHTHPLAPTPPVPVGGGVKVDDLLQQLQNASNTILNQYIRIN